MATLTDHIDTKAVEEHLGSAIDRVTPLEKGYLNRKFLVSSSNTCYVLKIYSDHLSFVSPKLRAECRAQAEYRALQLCQSCNLGAPLPIALFDKAVLMTAIEGNALTDQSLTADLISRITSWLAQFHSQQLPPGLTASALVNPPLIGAIKNLEKYIEDHPSDSLASKIQRLLMTFPRSYSDVSVPLRGDPTLANWHISKSVVYGLDFEFFGIGNPIFDLGLFVASILDHTRFSKEAHRFCQRALAQYMRHNSSISLAGIELAVLCALILIAVSIPNAHRCRRIFRQIHDTLDWIRTADWGLNRS